ncbi:MAG TPA: hypothetical protein VG345_14050 [Bryobacteraceae bacterium]|nr:hypothetical protein [Bryobacteraceae bacterium]
MGATPDIRQEIGVEAPAPVRQMSTGADRGLRWYWHLLAFCLAVAIIVSRRPDALFHAQFFAEDGRCWFADAYNRGWFVSLFKVQDGYFSTLSRLAAALSLLAPLRDAPLVMNLVGLLVQVLPVSLLISRRLASLGSLRLRCALALMYLAMPNCIEINVSVEYCQWHMALVECLLVLASAPRGKIWKTFDCLCLLVAGLAGPLCLMLLPISAVYAWARRERWRLVPVAILAFTSAIQLCGLFILDPAIRARAHPPLGASFKGLARILAGQIYLGALGLNVSGAAMGKLILACAALAGTVVLIYWMFRAKLEFRLFAAFCILVFAAALRNPFILSPAGPPPAGMTAWQILAGTPAIRYWFLPTLMFCWMAVCLAFSVNRLSRWLGAALLFLMFFGIVRNWRYPALPDMHFETYAQRLETSPKGTGLVIPQNPPGWSMLLVKR